MSADNQHEGDPTPEWNVARIPSDGDIISQTEKHNAAFQHVFDQLELAKQTDPENFSKELNMNKALWKLPPKTRQRVISYFIEGRQAIHSKTAATLREEEAADRRQEVLEDNAGMPANRARAIAREEPIETPFIGHRPHVDSVSLPEPADPLEPGTAENKDFLATELASVARIEGEQEPIPWPEEVKFGIEPDGIVTHSRRERKAHQKLQGDDYKQGGGLRYLKVVSSFNKDKRSPEDRIETMSKSLNHMFDYLDDAHLTMDALRQLLKKISEQSGSPDELLSEQGFLEHPDPMVEYALEAVTFYREALEAERNPRQRVKGTLAERTRRTTHETVDTIETAASELYFLEQEREKSWDIQLRGYPADREKGIPQRFGAIEIAKGHPELADIIDKRLREKPAESVGQRAS